MRRISRLAAAAVCLSSVSAVGTPQPAHAQLAVICPTCSSQVTQGLQLVKEAASLAQQIQMYQNMLLQYSNMLQNTATLPSMAWNNATSDIMRIQSLMNSVQMLAGNAQSFTSTLSNVQGFSNQLQTLQQMDAQYEQWGTVTANDITQMQASIGVQETERDNDAATLAVLQGHSQSAQGQMQALQAGNEMAALGVSQTQKLQEMLAQESQLVVDQTSTTDQRQAAADSALEEFLQSPIPPLAGNGHGYQ